MKHIALLLSYDGSAFHGWQSQENALSVQDALARGICQVSGERPRLRGSSRTDSQVSARGHVADFFSELQIPIERLPQVLNAQLPESLAVRAARLVGEDFHARFQALGKLYVYRFDLGSVRDPLTRHLTVWRRQTPDLEKMQALAEELQGTHDFAAFMDQNGVVRRTVRRLDRLLFLQRGQQLAFCCLGEGFLYHQVRILAGTLYSCGVGKLERKIVLQAMTERKRPLLGPTFPPQGLCLERVYYPQLLFGEDDRRAYEKLAAAPDMAFLPFAFSALTE